ncbi:MAG TPA: FIST N-terminal domain-containing protein [Polyangiaceae bacterium]|nr:FIST N-terminal domain-containing protein [Polyangiaceae bacterium]
MTETAIAYSNVDTTEAAAQELCDGVSRQMPGKPADAMILFASPRYDATLLLQALKRSCNPRLLVGASSSGEFTHAAQGEGMACVLALRSDSLLFAAGVGRGLSKSREQAAREMAASFRGPGTHTHPYRSALVMTDALAGHADDLVDQLTLATSGQYQFFGGGAGDDAQFQRTSVFFGEEALTDAAVALEILSKKPIGVGVGHGWKPASAPMRVTEADGMRLISLNGLPAADAFDEHAQETAQTLDRAAPLPYFLHNIIGIDTGNGYRLRVPLSISSDGSVACASEIPVGATVHIMRTDQTSAIDAASRATTSAIDGLQGGKPKVALFFDCVATRLRIGDGFGLELEGLAQALGPAARYLGCNTHGQIARAEGQFGGFHNCTAVVCVLPE